MPITNEGEQRLYPAARWADTVQPRRRGGSSRTVISATASAPGRTYRIAVRGLRCRVLAMSCKYCGQGSIQVSSQADGAGSIPVTRSSLKAQVSPALHAHRWSCERLTLTSRAINAAEIAMVGRCGLFKLIGRV